MAAYQVMYFLLLGGCDNKTLYYRHGISRLIMAHTGFTTMAIAWAYGAQNGCDIRWSDSFIAHKACASVHLDPAGTYIHRNISL